MTKIYNKHLIKSYFQWLQDRMAKQSFQSQETPPGIWDLISLQKDGHSRLQIAKS